MGQNQYADWFINAMLGWIRFIANGVASMFQTSSSRMSSGNALLNWFSANWITLLVSMIVIGIVVDWLVWMVRWRPYWLWFHKKRILLDDDIDLDLSDEELMRRYAPKAQRRDTHPHFRGSSLGRAGRYAASEDALYDDDEYGEGYDDEYAAPDIEDPYLDDEDAYAAYDDEDDDIMPAPRHRADHSSDDDEDDEAYDELYGDDGEYDEYADGEDDGEYIDDDEENPDVSFLLGEDEPDDDDDLDRKPRRAWFSALRRAKNMPDDDDPFSVDDAAFDDPDDDFFSVISDASPLPALQDEDEQADTSVYKAGGHLDAEFADELPPDIEPKDWRTGYSLEVPTAEPDASRKSRRRRREQRDE